MSTVWVTNGDATGGAAEGDYVLKPAGDLVEVGRVEGGEVCWLQPVPASTLPDLGTADGLTEAPEQDRALAAVRGVETALNTRGG
ncbi:MAG TPA: hypothetical protein VFQ85_08415 [Mycobacteriales bacterium]|jgi:hypothetical protein|nr:hypothetical protein [Mycobacteriales bacterium]